MIDRAWFLVLICCHGYLNLHKVYRLSDDVIVTGPEPPARSPHEEVTHVLILRVLALPKCSEHGQAEVGLGNTRATAVNGGKKYP